MGLFSSKKKIKILAVDDEADILSLFRDILQFRGYAVVCAQNGEEALQVALSETPSIIFLDVMMPKMDGITTLTILKSNPKTKDIPVVMVTVLQQGKDVERAFAMGASGYLIKPFLPDRLIKKLEEVLGPSKG